MDHIVSFFHLFVSALLFVAAGILLMNGIRLMIGNVEKLEGELSGGPLSVVPKDYYRYEQLDSSYHGRGEQILPAQKLLPVLLLSPNRSFSIRLTDHPTLFLESGANVMDLLPLLRQLQGNYFYIHYEYDSTGKMNSISFEECDNKEKP